MYHADVGCRMTMLDSRSEGALSMTERQEKTLDEQFQEVSVAFAEARDYTDFCYTRLDDKITGVSKDLGTLTTEVRALDTKVTEIATTMDRRFTRNELLLTEVLNEVRGLSRAR
jgi:hypothetical protein